MPGRGATAFWLGAIACWAALLAAGAAWIRARPAAADPKSPAAAGACLDARAKGQHAGFPAVRALAVNHWIGEGDLEWTAPSHGAQKTQFVWQYVSCAVKPGERVVKGEVRAIPVVAPASGRQTFPLLLRDPRLRGVLNAGSTIDVFQDTQPIARGLRVLAVDCGGTPPASSGDCHAILEVGADDVVRLQALRNDVTRLVVVATKS